MVEDGSREELKAQVRRDLTGPSLVDELIRDRVAEVARDLELATIVADTGAEYVTASDHEARPPHLGRSLPLD